jgi:hypothetical protein
MKRITKRMLALSALMAMAATTTAAFADANPYQYYKTTMDRDSLVVVVEEPSDVSNNSILAVQPPAASIDNRGRWLWCSDATDKTCDFNNTSLDLYARQLLPNCSENMDEICIESLEVAAPNEDYKEAKFIRTAVGGIRYPAVKSMNLHAASTPSLYKAENAPNEAGTTTYAVTMKMEQWWDHGAKKFNNGPIIANVSPYKEVAGNYKGTFFDKTAKPEEAYGGGGSANACVWADDGICGQAQDFVPGTRARVKFHIPSDVGGWFSGRLKDPEISINKLSATANTVTIGAESVTVPRLALVRKRADLSDREKNFNLGQWGIDTGQALGLRAFDREVSDFIDLYRPMLKDTAAGTNSYWNMQSATAGRGSDCLTDTSKVLGIVTTNAMGYSGDSPTFSKGMLDYKVAGLHWMPDGKTEVEGSYDFIMRSETARCLYGFSKAPISARVSVTSATGENKVATTIVKETKDGWLKLAAYGFTFSSPTISVKLSQSGAATAAKKTTITCAKGKLTKKVTAVGPKCPSGYKKK